MRERLSFIRKGF